MSFELQFIERSTKKREKITIERKSYVFRQSDDAIRAEENGEQEQQASVDLHPYSTVDDINLWIFSKEQLSGVFYDDQLVCAAVYHIGFIGDEAVYRMSERYANCK